MNEAEHRVLLKKLGPDTLRNMVIDLTTALHFAKTCEYCGVPMGMPLDKSNQGAQHHRTCGLTAVNLRGIMQLDISSALDDCVELGMTAEQMRDAIKTIIAKTLQA